MSEISGGTSIMGLSKKFVIIFAVGSLPLMLMYQNCSKTQNFEMQDMTSLKADGSLPFDTGSLQPGQGVVLEPGIGGSDENRYQVEPREKEPSNSALGEPGATSLPAAGDGVGEADLFIPKSGPVAQSAEALVDCSPYMDESNNANESAQFSSDSASGVQGKKVLTPEHFGGNRFIKSISNTGGHIVLCNLEVESYSDSNGRVDLVNSNAVFVNHSGGVFKIDLSTGAKVNANGQGP